MISPASQPVSDLFLMALRKSQGHAERRVSCGCGREHYATYSDDDAGQEYYRMDAEELVAELGDMAVIYHDSSVVEYAILNDTDWVLECPCNKLSTFEDFIWADRNTILTYIKIRTDQERAWAEQGRILNKLAGL